MKAIYLVRFGNAKEAFETREVPVPEPGEGQVRIRVEAFGLNYADVMARKGKYRDCPPLPCVLGYDVVGKVDSVGKGISNLQPGDHITALTRFNSYAEFVVTPAAGVAKIPDSFPLSFAGELATQYCTAYYSGCECVNVFPGETVLIHAAAGGVGTGLVQLMKNKGAVVIGTCGSDEKVAFLKTLGVDHAINYRTDDYVSAVKQITGTRGVDFVFDSLGGKYFRDGVKLLSVGGKIVLYGVAMLSSSRSKLSMIGVLLQYGFYHPLQFMIKSRGFAGVSIMAISQHRPEVLNRCLQNVVALAKEGKLKPAGGSEYPVSQLADAHEALENRRTMGKVMVKW